MKIRDNERQWVTAYAKAAPKNANIFRLIIGRELARDVVMSPEDAQNFIYFLYNNLGEEYGLFINASIAPSLDAVNEALVQYGYPFRIDFKVDLKPDGKHSSYGFMVIPSYPDANIPGIQNQKLENISRMLDGFAGEEIPQESVEWIRGVFNVLYNQCFDPLWPNDPDGAPVNIEDMNLMMYNKRIPYRIYKKPGLTSYQISRVAW